MPKTSKPNPETVKTIWNDAMRGTAGQMVTVMSKTRTAKLAQRWREMGEVGDPLEVWRAIVAYIRRDKWHMDPSSRRPEHRGWRPSIDYVLRNDTKWLELWERAQAEQTTRRQSKPKYHQAPAQAVNALRDQLARDLKERGIIGASDDRE